MAGGGTSNVYKVTVGEKSYAIKASPFSLKKEADVYRDIGEHPHIIELIESGRVQLDTSSIQGDENTGEHNALVFPFIEKNLAISKDTLTKRQKVEVLLQTLDAVSYLHQQNYTHNDIKADDVLIDENNYTYLVDFNLAKKFNLETHNKEFEQAIKKDLAQIIDLIIFSLRGDISNEIISTLELLKMRSELKIEDLQRILQSLEFDE